MLNCCTKEELEESSDEEALVSPAPSEDSQERRKIIKNKILAVGRMSRVFALLRYVSPSKNRYDFSPDRYPVRSQRKSLNSRVYRVLASYHMVHWPWVQKALRMPLTASRKRACIKHLHLLPIADVITS